MNNLDLINDQQKPVSQALGFFDVDALRASVVQGTVDQLTAYGVKEYKEKILPQIIKYGTLAGYGYGLLVVLLMIIMFFTVTKR